MYKKEYEKEQHDWIVKQLLEHKHEVEHIKTTELPAIDTRINKIRDEISLKNRKNVSEFTSIHNQMNLLMLWKNNCSAEVKEVEALGKAASS